MIDSAMPGRVAKAIHNRLSTDLGVQAELGDPPRLYDSAPEDPIFPYLTYGDMKSEDEGGDGVSLARHSITLHIWSRYSGRAEVFDVIDAVGHALEGAPISLEQGQVVISAIPYMDVIRARDGRTLQGLIRLNIYTQSGVSS